MYLQNIYVPPHFRAYVPATFVPQTKQKGQSAVSRIHRGTIFLMASYENNIYICVHL